MDKQYNSQTAEMALKEYWERNKIYSMEHNPGEQFSIDTPPPTISGSLHIGHIFSYTQTDIIARFKRLDGYSVFYPFGFDDNGLPTEKFIEKKCDVRPHELGRSAFIELCLEQTKEVEGQFKELWQKMGLSVDWNHWYSTISQESRRISQLSFIKLYKAGYIYRKDEPALYCTNCRTTVAQAELDDAQKSSHFNDIVFKAADGSELIVATTRPELLYSTSALLFNPQDSRYAHLKDTTAIVPIYNREIPILEDELVDIDKGTGLVMVSTFGDQTDIHWYKKHGLPLRLSIGLDGKWLPETGVLANLRVSTAREKMIEELKAAGSLKNQKAITHAVNVHERCKKEIEYIVLTQWFVNVLAYKQEFLDLADKIKWYPHFMKSRYVNWVQNIKWDWCISRQRFYGIPFPVWHCKDCKAIIVADEKNLPIDPQEVTIPERCTECKSSAIAPDMDVMDTWNTSSLTPYITYNLLAQKENPFSKDVMQYLPMGMRPQAHDIIRTWAFYTIIKVWMHNKDIPWHEIVISGHVLSNEKEKISKSKGNNPLAPETLLQTYSADVIRYWTASGSLGQDISFSESQLKIGQKLVTKLWNAFRFAEPHLEGFKPKDAPKKLGLVNEWILDQSFTVFQTYKRYFEKHEFGLALHAVEQYFWTDFCDNYLELIKHQLFNPHDYTKEEVYATRWALYHVGLRILQFYSPYMPYVTETIYAEIYKKTVGFESIHQTKFVSVQTPCIYPQSTNIMSRINTIVSEVRKLKTTQQLSLKTPIDTLTIPMNEKEDLEKYEQLIKGVAQAEHIIYGSDYKKSELIQHQNGWNAYIWLEK